MSDRPTSETDDIARGNHVVPTEWAKQLERERDEAREKIERQANRIRYLEGATNYAKGTPLSIALRERDDARRKLNNLDVTAIHSCHNECQRPICVLRRERDEAREKLSAAWRSLRDSQDEVLRLTFQNRSLSQELDKAREALMEIEDLFIDGTDIYADRGNMGMIAKTALEETK